MRRQPKERRAVVEDTKRRWLGRREISTAESREETWTRDKERENILAEKASNRSEVTTAAEAATEKGTVAAKAAAAAETVVTTPAAAVVATETTVAFSNNSKKIAEAETKQAK